MDDTFYQASAEQARSRALLIAHDAATADAVVDELVLLSQAIARVSSRKQNGEFVLPFFCIKVDKLIFLFGRRQAAALLAL